MLCVWSPCSENDETATLVGGATHRWLRCGCYCQLGARTVPRCKASRVLRLWSVEPKTNLLEHCEYLVRRPDETWKPRAKKDPRDLKILDPACGSGHFLLYSFDLFLVIYEESWADPDAPPSALIGRSLREDYPNLKVLRSALPGLIVRHNLHGVDIDPRCAQIAQLSLWMRAQRAFRDYGITRSDRTAMRRANIVISEPMPGERDLLQEFLRGLKEDRLEGLLRHALDVPADRTVRATKAMADSLAELVTAVWNSMRLAGEMGPLLEIDRALESAIENGRAEWEDRLPLFRVAEYGLEQGRVAPVKETYVRCARRAGGFLEQRLRSSYSRRSRIMRWPPVMRGQLGVVSLSKMQRTASRSSN
jgi:hypothetical protein